MPANFGAWCREFVLKLDVLQDYEMLSDLRNHVVSPSQTFSGQKVEVNAILAYEKKERTCKL
jgi:hypothetical protein